MVVVAVLVALSVVLALLRDRLPRVQSVVGYYLVVIGVALAVFGFAITFRTGVALAPATLDRAVSALAPTLGLLLAAAGAPTTKRPSTMNSLTIGGTPAEPGVGH